MVLGTGSRTGSKQAAMAAQACSVPFVSISLDLKAAQGKGRRPKTPAEVTL